MGNFSEYRAAAGALRRPSALAELDVGLLLDEERQRGQRRERGSGEERGALDLLGAEPRDFVTGFRLLCRVWRR